MEKSIHYTEDARLFCKAVLLTTVELKVALSIDWARVSSKESNTNQLYTNRSRPSSHDLPLPERYQFAYITLLVNSFTQGSIGFHFA